MGEHNSPFFKAGLADGRRDMERVRSCPPLEPLGLDKAREWSWMYKRGYERAFTGERHSCPSCRGAGE